MSNTEQVLSYQKEREERKRGSEGGGKEGGKGEKEVLKMDNSQKMSDRCLINI